MKIVNPTFQGMFIYQFKDLPEKQYVNLLLAFFIFFTFSLSLKLANILKII